MKQVSMLMLLLCLYLTGNYTFAQKDGIKKNIISFSPIGLMANINHQYDPVIKLSYERYILRYMDLVFATRFRINNSESELFSGSFLFSDPYYEYDKYAGRLGVLFHKGAQFLQPMIQYEQGSFSNKKVKTDNPEGDYHDVYEQMDRNYNSIGLIILVGFRQSVGNFSVKYYIGPGVHNRYYHETIYGKIGYDWNYNYEVPINKSYIMQSITLHTGFELGYRF